MSESQLPRYKMSLHERAVREKKFDYKKKFTTIPKKTDPVSRMQQMNR